MHYSKEIVVAAAVVKQQEQAITQFSDSTSSKLFFLGCFFFFSEAVGPMNICSFKYRQYLCGRKYLYFSDYIKFAAAQYCIARPTAYISNCLLSTRGCLLSPKQAK